MAQSLMSTLSSPKKRMEKFLSKALESQDSRKQLAALPCTEKQLHLMAAWHALLGFVFWIKTKRASRAAVQLLPKLHGRLLLKLICISRRTTLHA